MVVVVVVVVSARRRRRSDRRRDGFAFLPGVASAGRDPTAAAGLADRVTDAGAPNRVHEGRLLASCDGHAKTISLYIRFLLLFVDQAKSNPKVALIYQYHITK